MCLEGQPPVVVMSSYGELKRLEYIASMEHAKAAQAKWSAKHQKWVVMERLLARHG